MLSKYTLIRRRIGMHCLFAVAIVILVLIPCAFAQSDTNPKWDVFAGYQYFHPGITVPAAFSDPNNPIPFKVQDMTKGLGAALTYNFDPHWGAEFDLGENWGNGNDVTTVSFGPRFIWRTDDANFFLHALVGLNRLSVPNLNEPNGVGVILAGVPQIWERRRSIVRVV